VTGWVQPEIHWKQVHTVMRRERLQEMQLKLAEEVMYMNQTATQDGWMIWSKVNLSGLLWRSGAGGREVLIEQCMGFVELLLHAEMSMGTTPGHGGCRANAQKAGAHHMKAAGPAGQEIFQLEQHGAKK
jgi:hypothetical protein